MFASYIGTWFSDTLLVEETHLFVDFETTIKICWFWSLHRVITRVAGMVCHRHAKNAWIRKHKKTVTSRQKECNFPLPYTL